MTRIRKNTICLDIDWLGSVLTFGLFGTLSGIPHVLAAEDMEGFNLPYWSGEERFSLNDQPEGILILDFFAYWCVPCLQTSRELEHNIFQFYLENNGNPHGLPVSVLSINIEASHPKRTEAFIKKTGARLVLNDPGGKILEKMGAKALPHVAILQARPEGTEIKWEVIYQKSGYEGTETIRSIIDTLLPLPEAVPSKPSLKIQKVNDEFPEQRPVTVVVNKKSTESPLTITENPVQNTFVENKTQSNTAETIHHSPEPQAPEENEANPQQSDNISSSESISSGLLETPKVSYLVNADILSSSDVFMWSGGVERKRQFESGAWELTINYGQIDVDYEPFSEADVIGKPTHLLESNHAAQFLLSNSLSPYFEYQVSGGSYFGFTNHRSLWLDEYYRQQFSGIDGYKESDPWGYNLSGGASWDTTSLPGILSATLIFQQDDVAPGYDRPLFQPLERGRERLYTGSLLLEQESVLSPRARMRNQLQFTQTTDREFRYRYSGYVNLALSENWVLRSEGAATYEAVVEENEEDFRSYSVGISLEYDWDQTWFLGLTGRRYRDNGQIETSILVSAGPPPLHTSHLGLTLRHQGENLAWKFSLAAYQTDFDEIDSPIRPFANLYRDRDWLLASASYNHQF